MCAFLYGWEYVRIVGFASANGFIDSPEVCTSRRVYAATEYVQLLSMCGSHQSHTALWSELIPARTCEPASLVGANRARTHMHIYIWLRECERIHRLARGLCACCVPLVLD